MSEKAGYKGERIEQRRMSSMEKRFQELHDRMEGIVTQLNELRKDQHVRGPYVRRDVHQPVIPYPDKEVDCDGNFGVNATKSRRESMGRGFGFESSSRGYFGRERDGIDQNRSSMKLTIPSFQGKSDPDAYIQWERKLELVFDYHYYSEKKKVKLAVETFIDYAITWWDQFVLTRRRCGEPLIEDWESMKAIMRRRFVPAHYYRELKMQSLRQVTKLEKRISPRWESQRSSPASMVRESLQKPKREKSKTEQQFKTKRGECPSKQFVNLWSNIEDATKEKKIIYVSPPQRNDSIEIPMEENVLDIMESIGVKIEGMQDDIVELQPEEDEKCKTTSPLDEKEGSDSRTNPFEEVENDMIQPCIEVNAELTKVQTLSVNVDEMAVPREMLHPFSIQRLDALGIRATKYPCSYTFQWLQDGVFCDVVQRCVSMLPKREIDYEIDFVCTPSDICPDSRTNPFKEGENDTIRTSSKTKNWKKGKRVRLMEPFVLGLKNKGFNQTFEESVVWNWKKRKRRSRWTSRIPCIRDSHLSTTTTVAPSPTLTFVHHRCWR
ncbi:PREDICTED: uncharacterized protein LOC105953558 [Erythranthe guttata]|uniref:uncharacterized protein LOC105953558 n=1 Tax=Erythranthe guttata TaxID=4155 RepID=UPI00064DB474|nr:PREDICTED: uncharacterized protein LOC105953558 [Erythranthe guttata]|eukprot:XP_012832689.1 PREDICTED: uncharacterized protein LOC105953558 [Erythranthe guttata]